MDDRNETPTADHQKLDQHWAAVQAALKLESPRAAAVRLFETVRTARAALAGEKAELALLIIARGEEAVLTLDSMGVITGATAVSAEILGRRVEDIVGRPIDFFLKNRSEEPPVSAREMEAAGRGAEVVSVRIQERADGTTFEAQHTVMAVIGRLGDLSGFIRQIEDISERTAHELRIDELDATIALLLPSSRTAHNS